MIKSVLFVASDGSRFLDNLYSIACGGGDPHRLYTLDTAGDPNPCDDREYWNDWIAPSLAERTVAKTEYDDPNPYSGSDGTVVISTVFLGAAHGDRDGAPLLWETAIFGGELGGSQDRWISREEAEAGHQQIVDLAREADAEVELRQKARER